MPDPECLPQVGQRRRRIPAVAVFILMLAMTMLFTLKLISMNIAVAGVIALLITACTWTAKVAHSLATSQMADPISPPGA